MMELNTKLIKAAEISVIINVGNPAEDCYKCYHRKKPWKRYYCEHINTPQCMNGKSCSLDKYEDYKHCERFRELVDKAVEAMSWEFCDICKTQYFIDKELAKIAARQRSYYRKFYFSLEQGIWLHHKFICPNCYGKIKCTNSIEARHNIDNWLCSGEYPIHQETLRSQTFFAGAFCENCVKIGAAIQDGHLDQNMSYGNRMVFTDRRGDNSWRDTYHGGTFGGHNYK